MGHYRPHLPGAYAFGLRLNEKKTTENPSTVQRKALP